MAENKETSTESEDDTHPRPSFVTAPSPTEQYQELRSSLATQVQKTRQNLNPSFDQPGADTEAVISQTDDTALPPKYSLVTQEATSSRDTMAWEEKMEQAANTPLPDEDGDGEGDDEMDETLNEDLAARLEQYRAYAADLKKRLLAERQKVIENRRKLTEERNQKRKFEAELREQLCNEFSEMRERTKIQTDEIHRKQIATIEDNCDEKIQKCVESFRTQLKERAAEIEQEKEDLNLELTQSKTEMELLRDENNIMKEQILRLSTEPKTSQNGNENAEELKNQVEEKERENRDLTEMLEEAGQSFLQQQNEIDTLKKELENQKALKKKSSDENLPPKSPRSKACHSGDNIEASTQTACSKSHFENLSTAGGEMESKTNEIDRLKQQIADLHEKLNENSSDDGDGLKLIELESKIFDLEQQLTSAKNDNKKLIDQSLEVENEVIKLKSENSKLDQEIFNLHEDSKKKESQLESLKNSLAESQSDATQLKSDLADIRSQKEAYLSQIEEIESEKVKLESDLNDLSSKFQTTQDLNETLDKEKDENQKKLDQSDAELSVLHKELKSVRTDVKEGKDRLEKDRSLRHEVTAERDSLRKKYDAAVTLMSVKEKATEKAEKKVKEVIEEKEKVEKKVESLEIEVRSLNKEKSTVSAELEQLKVKSDELKEEAKTHRDRASQFNENVHKCEQRLSDCESKLASKQQEIDTLVTELNETKAHLVKLRDENSDHRKKQMELGDEVSELNGQKVKLEHSIAQIENSLETERNEIKRLQRVVSDQSLQIEGYKSGIKETEEVQQKFEEVLKNKDSEISALNKRVDQQEIESREKENKVNLLKSEQKRLTKDLQLKTAVESELKKNITSLQVQYENADKELQGCRLKIADYKQQVDIYDGSSPVSVSQLLLKNKDLKKQLAKEATENATAVKALSAERDKLKEICDKLEEEKSNFAQKMFEKENEKRRLEKDLQDCYDSKVKEVEDVKVEYENKLAQVSTTNSRRKQTFSTSSGPGLDDLLVKDEIEVSPVVTSRSQKASTASRRGRKTKKSSQGQNERAGLAEVTVDGSTVKRSRRKPVENKFFSPDDETEPTPQPQTTKKRAKNTKNTSSKSSVASKLDSGSEPPSRDPSPVQSTAKKPPASRRRQNTKSMVKPKEEIISDDEFHSVSPTPRPSRVAKSVANDGIIATNFHNSPIGKIVSSVGKKMLETVAYGAPLNEDSSVPPKKRFAMKRLYKTDVIDEKLECTPEIEKTPDDEKTENIIKSVITKSMRKMKK